MDNQNTSIVSIKKISLLNMNPSYSSLLEWLEDPSHIYIGRNMSFYVPGANKSKWHNPFKVGKPGKIYKNTSGMNERYTLDESLALYKIYVLNNEELMNSIEELKGKTLGCWCKPNRCHGDVLIEILDDLDNLGGLDGL